MASKTFILIATLSFFLLGFKAPKDGSTDDGETLFMAKCAACHAPNKVIVGPPFQGIRKDYAPEWIYAMVRNHDSVCNTAGVRASYLSNVWGNVNINRVFHLSDGDITSILDFVDSQPPAKNYYRHRKMSDQELNNLVDFIHAISDEPGSDQYIRVLDSLRKI